MARNLSELLRKSDEDLEEMFNEDGEDESSSNVLLDGDEHFSDEEAAEMRDDVEADIDLAAEVSLTSTAMKSPHLTCHAVLYRLSLCSRSHRLLLQSTRKSPEL